MGDTSSTVKPVTGMLYKATTDNLKTGGRWGSLCTEIGADRRRTMGRVQGGMERQGPKPKDKWAKLGGRED